MRIASIEIDNFRSYERAEYRFTEPVAFILGRNGTGKSTVIEALQWCLTGKTRGVDGTGAGFKDLMRSGAAAMGVRAEVELEAGGPSLTVTRRATTKGAQLQVSAWTGASGQQQQALYEVLEANEDVLLAVLDTTQILDAHHAAAKSTLMGVLNVRVEHPDKPGEFIPIEELDRLHDEAFTDRTAARKRLAAILVPPAPEEVPPPIEELEAELEAVREEERQLIAQTSDARARHEQLGKQLQDLETRLRQVSAKLSAGDVEASGDLATLRTREASLIEEYSRITTQRNELHARLKRIAADVGRLRAQVSGRDLAGDIAKVTAQLQDLGDPAQDLLTLEAELAGGKLAADTLEDRLFALTDASGAAGTLAPGACVLGADIPCHTPRAEFDRARVVMQAQLDEIKKRREKDKHRIAALRTKVATVDEARGKLDALREMQLREGSAQDQITRLLEEQRAVDAELAALPEVNQQPLDDVRAEISLLERAMTQRQLQAEHADLARRRDQVNAEIGKLPPINPATALELTKLQLRIRRGHEVIRDARRLHAENEKYQRALKDREDAQKLVDSLEDRVTTLGPKGIRVQALEHAIEAFHALINEHLVLYGYELRFWIDPWRILVNQRPASLLSTSERLRVGAALQLAIAEVTKLRFAAIDQADLLDAKNRDLFTDIAFNFEGQVLIASTKDDDEIPPEVQVRGLDLFHVRRDADEQPSRVTKIPHAAAAAIG